MRYYILIPIVCLCFCAPLKAQETKKASPETQLRQKLPDKNTADTTRVKILLQLSGVLAGTGSVMVALKYTTQAVQISQKIGY